MLVALWVLLIISGLIIKKSDVLSVIQVAFMIILMGTCSQTVDYNTYKNIYLMTVNAPLKSLISSNWLFKVFIYVFGKYTSFQFVVFMISAVGMVLIYYSIKYYTDNTAYVLSLYMIASFVIDATQFKNFFAMSVWMFFSRYLYQLYTEKGDAKKNIIKYLTGVFLATSIHAVMLITIVFLLFKIIDIKKLLMVALIITVFFMCIDWLSVIDYFMAILSKFNNSLLILVVEKYKAYAIGFDFEKIVVRMLLCVIYLVMVIGLYVVTNRLKKKYIYAEQAKLLEFVYCLNVIVICIMPLLFFSLEFYRIQRNLLLLNYISIASYMKKLDLKVNLRNSAISIGGLCLAGYYLYIDAIMWNYSAVFLPLFRAN